MHLQLDVVLGPFQCCGLVPVHPYADNGHQLWFFSRAAERFYGTGTSPVFWFGSPCAFMGFVLNEGQFFLVGSYYVPGLGCISWRSSPTADVYNVGTFPVFWFGLHVFLLWAA